MLVEEIKVLVEKEKWSEVDHLLLPLLHEKSGGLEAVLLYSATLRARNEGEKANKVLSEASHRRYATEIKIWSQFAEELMQSGLWHEAKDVIQNITKADTKLGNFLQLIFFRETENWSEFEKTKGESDGQFLGLIKIQDAWNVAFTGGVSQTTSTSAGYKYISITAAGVSDTVTFS